MATPLLTARRNLAHRINVFLRGPDGTLIADLSGWQSDRILTAIEALDEGSYAAGEDIMMRVEKASIFEPAGYVPVDRKDAAQLLEQLRRALGT